MDWLDHIIPVQPVEDANEENLLRQIVDVIVRERSPEANLESDDKHHLAHYNVQIYTSRKEC